LTEDPDEPEFHSRSDRARQIREERRDNAAARINVTTLFERLGYDLTDQAEITRLNENLRYAERQRRRYERMENSKVGWIVSLLLVITGAAITAVVQWVTSVKGHP